MNTNLLRVIPLSLALAAMVPLVSAAPAQEDHKSGAAAAESAKGQLVPVTDKDAAWVEKAKAEYPTNMCIVSDEKLGAEMGKPADFIYREAGKPDRMIRFCCEDCSKDFSKEPQKFLKALDEAAAGKKADAKSGNQM